MSVLRLACKASFLYHALEFFMTGSADAAPPTALNGLRVFDAAAWHESFTRAAVALRVTQGAGSHQVKAPEAKVGVKLFKR
jgi:hypothetical protein